MWVKKQPLELDMKQQSGSNLGNKQTKLLEMMEFHLSYFKILKDHAVKVLHSVCQQTWKTQKWPQD